MRENWEIRKLGDLTTALNGLWVGKKPPFVNIAVIRNTNFTKDCQLDTTDIAYIDAEVKHFSTRKLQCGDIIIEKSGGSDKQPVGRPVLFNIPEGDFSFSNFTSTLRINDQSEILPSFLHKALWAIYRSGKTANLQSKTTGIRNLDFKSYLKLPIPVPPIAEQEKIVAELDCLTGIIEKKKQQLEDLDKLAQSIFYDMFGDIAHNSKQFHVEKICDLGELARGVSKHRPRNAPELLGGEMPLIQTGDVANADLFIREYHSTYSALGVSQSRVWEKGTICITIAANIGNCAILSFRACFPDSVVGFIHNDKLSLFYALFVFNNLQALLEEKARGIAQKNINLQILNELLIPVPPRKLQDLFAEKIEAIEKQKELVKRSIVETETLFNSRMDFWFN